MTSITFNKAFQNPCICQFTENSEKGYFGKQERTLQGQQREAIADSPFEGHSSINVIKTTRKTQSVANMFLKRNKDNIIGQTAKKSKEGSSAHLTVSYM